MKKLVYAFMLAVMLAFTGMDAALAQEKQQITEADYTNEKVEMADVMRENGKIYIVVAVLATVLGGMIYYLVSIDRKVSKIEKMYQD
ncbi:CcmD family protein [Limibacter armeniacum]|uniref:CcmD family protein n=1 Tax=Limibacter armeniacum TaxID=466084 RepID=UPI002FE68AB2